MGALTHFYARTDPERWIARAKETIAKIITRSDEAMEFRDLHDCVFTIKSMRKYLVDYGKLVILYEELRKENLELQVEVEHFRKKEKGNGDSGGNLSVIRGQRVRSLR